MPKTKKAHFFIIWEEPFRIFFPLAVVASVGGVLLWPMLHRLGLTVYPGVMHARVMTLGLAGFLIGFLGTAFPRLLASPRLSWGEILGLLGLWLASLGAYFANEASVGDGLFAGAAGLLAGGLVVRWLGFGRDTPPPGMPTALVGVATGAAAALFLAWRGGAWLSSADYRLAQLFLYQGMALLALVGVGPYLFPRLFGHSSVHEFPASAAPPAGWWRRFWESAFFGVAIQASMVVEAFGSPRWGMGLRAAIVVAWALTQTPLGRRAQHLTTPGTVMRVSSVSIIAGLAWAAWSPGLRVGILHLLFVSGFGLAMLGIGARVVLGHAGRHDLLAGKIGWLRVIAGLGVLAAATRVSAEYLPQIRLSHLDYAALTWAVIAVLWLWKLRRWFLVSEGDDGQGRSEGSGSPPPSREAAGGE